MDNHYVKTTLENRLKEAQLIAQDLDYIPKDLRTKITALEYWIKDINAQINLTKITSKYNQKQKVL